LPLHEAIASSIGNLDAALKPRFASQILLAGGASQLRGLVNELELRVKHELGQVGVAPDSVSVLLNQKRIDSRNLSWWAGGVRSRFPVELRVLCAVPLHRKGATVFAAAESSRGMWISRAEWQLHGLPLLRMRVPFAW
jgi:actin-related protein